MTSIGLEFLTQTGRSKLFTSVIQAVVDSRKALSGLENPNSETTSTRLEKKQAEKILFDAIVTNMGPVIKRVIIIPSALIGCVISGEDDPKVFQRSSNRHKPKNVILEELNSFYDDSVGVLSVPNPKDVGIARRIFVTTGFLLLRDSQMNYEFSDEEVAALLLHELGHIDHDLRIKYRVRKHNTAISDTIDFIRQTPDREVIHKLIAVLKESKNVDPKWTKTLKYVEHFFAEDQLGDEAVVHEAIGALCTVALSEASGFSRKEIDDLLRGEFALMETGVNKVLIERSADDFSSRNGTYQYLVSSLAKLDRLDRSAVDITWELFSSSPMAFVVNLFTHYKEQFNLTPDVLSSRYDPLVTRLELIVQTAKHAFSEEHLPDEAKADIKQQIVEAERVIKDYKSSSHFRIKNYLAKWRDAMSSLGRLTVFSFSDRLAKDYHNLQEATRDLSHHSLFFFAEQ